MDRTRKFVFMVLWACLACGAAGAAPAHEDCTQSTCIHLSPEIHHGCPSLEMPALQSQAIDVRRSELLLIEHLAPYWIVPGPFRRVFARTCDHYISPVGAVSTLSPHIPSTVLRC